MLYRVIVPTVTDDGKVWVSWCVESTFSAANAEAKRVGGLVQEVNLTRS